jgi:CheY-like chemotaxis protein
MVVEDDAPVRRIIARALEFDGFRVLSAAGPLEGLALFEREAESIALVIADVMMPDLTGPEMVARIAERVLVPSRTPLE